MKPCFTTNKTKKNRLTGESEAQITFIEEENSCDSQTKWGKTCSRCLMCKKINFFGVILFLQP